MTNTQLAKLEQLAERLLEQGNAQLALAREMFAILAAATGSEAITVSDERRLEPEPVAPKPPPAPTPAPVQDELRTEYIGRYGKINKEDILKRAQLLGTFTGREIAASVGLSTPQISRWLTGLKTEGHLHFARGHYECQSTPVPRDWVVFHKDETFNAARLAEALRCTEEKAQAELEKLMKHNIVRPVNTEGDFEYWPPEEFPSPTEHKTLAPPERTTRPAYEEARATGMPVRIRTERSDRRARSTPGSRQKIKNRDRNHERMEAAKEERARKQAAKALAEKAAGGGRRRK